MLSKKVSILLTCFLGLLCMGVLAALPCYATTYTFGFENQTPGFWQPISLPHDYTITDVQSPKNPHMGATSTLDGWNNKYTYIIDGNHSLMIWDNYNNEESFCFNSTKGQTFTPIGFYLGVGYFDNLSKNDLPDKFTVSYTPVLGSPYSVKTLNPTTIPELAAGKYLYIALPHDLVKAITFTMAGTWTRLTLDDIKIDTGYGMPSLSTPEPATWISMLLGLGLFVGIGTRKKSKTIQLA